MKPIHDDERKRRALIRAAGNGIVNGSGITIAEHNLSGASVVCVLEPETTRKRFHLPNPINFAKYAAKRYGRMCDAASAEGLPVPVWPFAISQKELLRRCELQLVRQAKEKIARAEKQAALVDAGIKNASNSKYFDAYLPEPLAHGKGNLPRRDAITTLELSVMVDADIDAQEIVRETSAPTGDDSFLVSWEVLSTRIGL